AGGTQRLPRLTGIPHAIELIARGRVVSAAEALSLGIVDSVTAGDLVAEAVAAAQRFVGERPRRTGDLAVPAADAAAVEQAAAKVLAKAPGQHAPGEAGGLVRGAAQTSLAEGLVDERATFVRLRDSDEARALRHIFFAERAAAKVSGLEGVEPRPI